MYHHAFGYVKARGPLDGSILTGGKDGHVSLWRPGQKKPIVFPAGVSELDLRSSDVM